ncbi:MAG TPA: DUF2891 domain-containing protein [Chitinophagaceae bacterium]|nr:DUF2891 domain-containing protein [Chitinophagaceae bacterium]
MKRNVVLTCLVFSFYSLQAQESLFRISKDSSRFELTEKGASHLASLPLKCILQEFPNKTNHTSNNDSDHVLLPKQLHPAFYGCFDWHSSVHGHWMLIRLLKLFPALPEATSIRHTLNKTITKENILQEVKYFSLPLTASWERTYGWAWILKMDEELYGWDDADGKRWHEALQPLTTKIEELWMKFLPKQTYANRTGVHPNTAFGLVFALDYAKKRKRTAFEDAIVASARKIFLNDKNAPALWEPNGADFLSPSLEEADLMRRVLPPKEFIAWFNKFFTLQGLNHLTVLPVVSDRADLQIVHLDGLCFSRSWCMKGIASVLPANDPRRKLLMRSSLHHLSASLPHVVSGEYGGEHWLASFAVYALVN